MVSVDGIARALFGTVGPSRVTVRGAAPGESDTTYIHAEVLASGAPTMIGIPQDGITTAPTWLWLLEHRTILVQDDCHADPHPPRMLTGTMGVVSQLLGPLFRGGELVGAISVHQQDTPRLWTEAEVQAMADAVAQLRPLWELDDPHRPGLPYMT